MRSQFNSKYPFTRGSVELTKQDGVVYKTPCRWGKAYKEETRRSLQERIKEHRRDLQYARTEASTEWNADIIGKGQGERVPVDSRAVYTEEIMHGFCNTGTAHMNNTFIRNLHKPRLL